MDDFAGDFQGNGSGKKRHVNTISLLLPAKQFSLNCSWTTERPLPAIEEFSCKLILLFDGVTPFEVREFFGLSEFEFNGLVDSLLKKRLVEIDPEGLIKASSVLRSKSNGGQSVPTLTTYSIREENVVFDLLTLSVIPRRSYQGVKYGLPEIPPPSKFGSVKIESVVEEFGRQYRAHLDSTRSGRADNTRLYKVSHCRPVRTVQVPIDMEIYLDVVPGEGVRVYRDVVERVGDTRKHALSNELEAQVADYLANLSIPESNFSFIDFCESIGDEVLLKYVSSTGFDLASWLNDRNKKNTGYGSGSTRGMLGPVYLPKNAITIYRFLGEAASEYNEEIPNAYWYPASVPLWGASGTDLEKFVRRFENELSSCADRKQNLIAFFNTQDSSEGKVIKKAFNARLPHGVSLRGGSPQDRVEILVVPGLLAIAQYHVQPNNNSSVTVPVGQLTTDPERIEKIERLFQSRVQTSSGSEILWSNSSSHNEDLLDEDFLGLESKPGKGRGVASSKVNKKDPVVKYKPSRAR
ncbi:MAG: hypothetical protein ACQEXG_08280 [Pseudomonadota bacterium]